MQETFEKSDILEAHSEIIREIFMQTNKQHHEWLLTSLLTGITVSYTHLTLPTTPYV